MTKIVPFLRPCLKGTRFEGHAVPLEFLKDLAVLEEMIVEVAKWKFLTDNPDRKRTPRGFTESIRLKLTGVAEGSAVLEIDMEVDAGTLFSTDHEAYVADARDAVVGAISAAERNESPADYLPEKQLSYFDRMGRSLRDDEAIEFPGLNGAPPARLTKTIRRILVQASSGMKEFTEETAIRGTVPEADQDKMTFQIQLLNGVRVQAPMPAEHMDTILEAFNGYKDNTRILLQGIGKFSRSNRLSAIDSIEHVSILDTLDVPARLEELQSLKNGWLEGKGLAPSSDGLDWLTKAFESNYPDELQLPFTYPTPEGGIQFEWGIGNWEATLEIDISGHKGEWHALNMESDQEQVEEFDLAKADGWRQLAKTIQQLTGGAF